MYIITYIFVRVCVPKKLFLGQLYRLRVTTELWNPGKPSFRSNPTMVWTSLPNSWDAVDRLHLIVSENCHFMQFLGSRLVHSFLLYPLVISHSYWKLPIYSWFTHWRWWLSMAILVYQRVAAFNPVKNAVLGLHAQAATWCPLVSSGKKNPHPTGESLRYWGPETIVNG